MGMEAPSRSMDDEIDLTRLRAGRKATVVRILGGYGLRRKLETLGIREGVEILKVSSEFMGGPLILQVGNTQVAIGFGMARKIVVSPQSTDNNPQPRE